jgi:hypothetical protein
VLAVLAFTEERDAMMVRTPLRCSHPATTSSTPGQRAENADLPGSGAFPHRLSVSSWVGGMLLSLILIPALHAEEVVWRSVRRSSQSAPTTSWPSSTNAVQLGRPVPMAPGTTPRAALAQGFSQTSQRRPGTPVWRRVERPSRLARVRHEEPSYPEPRQARNRFVVRAQGPGAPPEVPPIPDIPYDPGLDVNQPIQSSFWDRPFFNHCREFFALGGDEYFSSTGRWGCQSDPGFDTLPSPVTNPFFFEDPRALTELRPIFMYQSAPSGNPIFQGGHAEFFGLQGRLALSDRWSIVLNKLGFVSLSPNNPEADPTGEFSQDTGFAEINIGPKYTFLRNPPNGTVAALGLNFQIPGGSSGVFQDTGNLALDPYFSFAKNFGRLGNGWGSFNFIGALGYSFGLDGDRSDFLHTSVHFDWDVAGLHKFYPLFEINWFHYVSLGDARSVGFEGADLVNFGSETIDGNDYVTLGPGFRWNICGWWTLGLATEWTVTSAKGISDFRTTVDMIFRY